MIILASKSPRRIELLKDAKVEFTVVGSNVSEKIDESLRPEENAMKIALSKAIDVQKDYKDDIIIAADTIVVYKNMIYGKPKDELDAFETLRLLSGNTHQVITGVAIVKGTIIHNFYSVANVKFSEVTDEQINEYIKTGEPMDKAGSYAIQGIGKFLVETYDGDFLTIIGLPLKEVIKIIKDISK